MSIPRIDSHALPGCSGRGHSATGTLGVSEVAIILPEYLDFLRLIKDEAGDRLILVHHASFSTLEQNIEAVRGAEDAGAELVLLSYPPNFYPETEKEIHDYTKAVCDATGLAVMLFPMYLWGFSPRIHPSDIPVRLIRALIDDCPNIAAIKAEGGFPSIGPAVGHQRPRVLRPHDPPRVQSAARREVR